MRGWMSCPPVILGLPYIATLNSSSRAGFMMVIAGCNKRISDAFAQNDSFWLDSVPPRNLDLNGFALKPGMLSPEQRQQFERIAPTTLVHDGAQVLMASDTW